MIQISTTTIERAGVVNALAVFRREWEQVAASESLLRTRASVGFLLADVAAAIGLTADEQQQVFGTELAAELREELVFEE